jgi:hypothetical protein
MVRNKIILIILFLPLFAHSQVFKGVGARLGWTINGYGWNITDESIKKFYPDAPSLNEPWLGIYGEFLSKKYYSTMVEFGYRNVSFNFDYNTLDEHGNTTGTESIKNYAGFVSFALSEKFKYDINSWSFYALNGLKIGFQSEENIDMDFNNVLSNLKKTTFGYTGGLGSAKSFNRFLISLDFLFETDFNKVYDSPDGYIRKSGFGFRLGLGYTVPARSTKE